MDGYLSTQLSLSFIKDRSTTVFFVGLEIKEEPAEVVIGYMGAKLFGGSV